MSALYRNTAGRLSFIAWILMLITFNVNASLSPHESVQTATDELIDKLLVTRPLYETDKKMFYKEIDDSLAPFVDFKGFSKGVMAKYYRRANDEQKMRFAISFREALIKTYAKALVEFDNQKIVVKETTSPQKAPNKAKVELEVHGKDGTIYPVEYSLVLIEDQWMLRNIVINGINIGLQFRSQFSNYMQQYKNDIDEVINHWSVDV
jgi:phospholipid transport system substrate-binding protein